MSLKLADSNKSGSRKGKLKVTSKNTSQQKQNKYIIEKDKRFSDSIIWHWQEEFFIRQSNQAWSNSIVPYYITSNPFIAKTYANIVFNYLCDAKSTYSLRKTIYIVELGAGCGKFAYRFIQHFFTLLANSKLANLRVYHFAH